MTAQDGRVVRTVKVVDNGPDAARWNLVVLSEGYREDEFGQFATDVDDLADAVLAAEPFDALRQAVNVHRVDVASTDSGADDPPEEVLRPDPSGPPIVNCDGGTDTTARTFFDATFCGDGLNRRLLTVDAAAVLDVVDERVPEWDVAMVIVNSTVRGGSGGASVPVLSKSSDMHEVALHELGHAGFGLADEYEYLRGCTSGETDRDRYTGGEPVEVNVTAETDRTRVKWRHLIGSATAVPTTRNADCSRCDPQPNPVTADTVGLFEGARYFHCGAYRPVFECRMRRSDRPFCPVCQERIREVLRPHLPGRKSPMDFTVVSRVRQHFGDNPGTLPGVFAGQTKDFGFDCPGVDPRQEAVLTFQALGVGHDRSKLTVNDRVVFGDVPRTGNSNTDWAAQTLLVSPNTLRSTGNVLTVESRNSSGGSSGGLDEFVLDNLVVFYKTG